jgi:uncharacterized cofD-like protein
VNADTLAGQKVVALGGGHGLAKTLEALRKVTGALTAVVGVADDGGSSGRIRDEFDVLPPGDLRMALTALCDQNGQNGAWGDVIQYRFDGDGDLSGHSLGNLLITAVWKQAGDPVTGLAWVSRLIGAHGTVLPCSTVPLDIHAVARDSSGSEVYIQGQERIARLHVPVERVWIEPEQPPACREALAAIAQADAIVLGPGSWYTSVLPHLLIPDQRRALVATAAQRILIMNVNPTRDRETFGLALDEHVRILASYAPDFRIDCVLADPKHVPDRIALESAVQDLGGQVHYADVESDTAGVHDPDRLADALRTVLGRA